MIFEFPIFQRGIVYAGVYKMIIDNKWFYIGSSDNLKSRFRYWKTCLKNNSYRTANIQKVITDDSKINFIVIQQVKVGEDVKSHENLLLSKYFDDPFCLNMCPDAYSCTGKRLPIGVVRIAKEKGISTPSKKIAQFDSLGNLINTEDSILKMAKAIGISGKKANEISRVARGLSQVYLGYVFKFISEDGSFVDPVWARKEKLGKKVKQIDLNGNVVNTYQSVESAAKHLGCSADQINGVLKKKKWYKTAKGYKFEYA